MTQHAIRFWQPRDPTSLVIVAVEHGLEHDAAPADAWLAGHVSGERSDATTFEGIEAVTPRVRTYGVDPRLEHTRLYLPPAGFDGDAYWALLQSYVGTPYDLPGLLLALQYCLSHHPLGFTLSREALVFCSMLETLAVRAGGEEPFADKRPADNVTPSALEQGIIALGWTRVPWDHTIPEALRVRVA